MSKAVPSMVRTSLATAAVAAIALTGCGGQKSSGADGSATVTASTTVTQTASATTTETATSTATETSTETSTETPTETESAEPSDQPSTSASTSASASSQQFDFPSSAAGFTLRTEYPPEHQDGWTKVSYSKGDEGIFVDVRPGTDATPAQVLHEIDHAKPTAHGDVLCITFTDHKKIPFVYCATTRHGNTFRVNNKGAGLKEQTVAAFLDEAATKTTRK